MTQSNQIAAIPSGPRIFDLQRANDFKFTLLGMVGHDLRQPLQDIQNTYDSFELSAGTPREKARLKRGERALARITEQLDRLIGALHLHEHASDVRITPVSIFPLLLKLAEDNEDQAALKDIELRVCPTTAIVMTNPVLLDGILRNLVQNAVKYTRAGGRVLIGCRRLAAFLRIDVIDTGIGVPVEHLQRIFLAFERLDTTRKDGLGIGLYVAGRAAELLDYRIEARSTVARGSRFSVTIPTSIAASAGSSVQSLN